MNSPLQGSYYVHSKVGFCALALRDFAFSLFTPRHPLFPTCPPPKKVLLSNCAHLGDVVLMTSLLAPLKYTFPHLKIGVVVGSWTLPVVKKHPSIDWIHCVDHWKTNRSSLSFFQKQKRFQTTCQTALHEIQTVGYDVAIDLRFHFPNLIPLLWKAKIPTRIGFTSGGGGPLLTHPFSWVPSGRHAVEDFFSLLTPLEVKLPDRLKPSLPSTDFESFFKKKLKPKHYLILHPGSGAVHKQWPIAFWKELAEKLHRRGHVLCLTGQGAIEKKVIESILETVPGIDLCDALSWQQFVAIIENARCLVCSDTAAGHVASAFDVPTVSLTTGIHPSILWRPLGPSALVLVQPTPCSPCYLPKGCASMRCLHSITPDRVYDTVVERIR